MYHPTVIAKRLASLVDGLRARGITVSPKPLTPAQAEDWNQHLLTAKDRGLTAEEAHHIYSELTLCRADFKYYVERYAKVRSDAGFLVNAALKPSQEILHEHVAALELKAVSGEHQDGLLFQLLKGRQIGGSTYTNLLIGHRVFLYGNKYALIAADVQASSLNLFNMSERTYTNLPWWMKPERTSREKGFELNFGKIDSMIRVEWAKSTRGGKGVDAESGQMGRGSTVHLFHGSEIATWDSPEQIDYSVLPAIHRNAHTFGMLESTPMGKENYYYETWRRSGAGLGRWKQVFIGWYLEKDLVKTPPEGWEPLGVTKAHAAKVEASSPAWCFGATIRLSREQMYWWEHGYLTAKDMRRLYKYVAEYASDPESCFAATRPSVFSEEALHHLQMSAKPELGMFDIGMLG